jgi:hypothetical protein
MDVLLNPPFAKNPPIKMNIPAKTLGLVYAILGGIGVCLGLLGLLSIGTVAALAGIAGAFLGLLVLGTLISLVGTALAAWGGYRMYREEPAGKKLVVYGLLISFVGGVVSSRDIGGLIINAVFLFILYYLVIISRFEGEPAPVVGP